MNVIDRFRYWIVRSMGKGPLVGDCLEGVNSSYGWFTMDGVKTHYVVICTGIEAMDFAWTAKAFEALEEAQQIGDEK